MFWPFKKKEKYNIEKIFQDVTSEYYEKQDEPISIKLDKYLADFDDKTADAIREEFYEILQSTITKDDGRTIEPNDFEIETNNLYEKFISSYGIESLSSSSKKLKLKIDYFKQKGREESLVMPIRDYESLSYELDCLEYGLSHWANIKEFISSSSKKQIDIQKGLNLDKQKLSTFFYMMDKLGFVEKETVKNRVYIKKITDKCL